MTHYRDDLYKKGKAVHEICEHEEEGGYRCIHCGCNVNNWADQTCIWRPAPKPKETDA